MSNLIPFQFDTHAVRVLLDDSNTPWWVAKDVCEVLGLTDVAKSVKRLTVSEKGKNRIPTLGGLQEVVMVNESGLYRLIFRSDKPEARRFQSWVFEEVLPSIRKTGKYEVAPTLERFPELKAIVDLVEATAQARVIAEEAKALADAADHRAMVAETKADLALEDAHRLTLEEFILKNGLVRQFPASNYRAYATWLTTFCATYGLRIQKAPVYGKAWDDENAYPLAALGAWLRHETTRPRQVHLVQPPTQEA